MNGARYPAPQQAAWLKLANRGGALLARLGWRPAPLVPDVLIAEAIRATGLEDFGDPSFRAGLEHLVDAIEREARLSLLGHLATRRMLVETLVNRLRIVDYRRGHPQIATRKIVRPLIIMGLPRTGTTILFELLAQDPQHRAPLSWELAYPVPPAQVDSFGTDSRIGRLAKDYRAFEAMAPGINAIHEMGATLPQECILIMGYQFMSEQYCVNFRVPSYRHWYMNQDMTPTYRWHYQFLQYMQSSVRKPRWLLKTPPHIAFLDALLTVYPDAALVQTHRDPMEVMPSLASLVCTARAGFSDHVDPRQVADEEARHFADLLQRGLDYREQMSDESSRFFDVRFRDILADPIATIERMYQHFGFDLSPEGRDAMVTYLEQRPREKHGVHRYSLEQFGLSRQRHGRLFTGYCQRFDL